MEFSFSPLSFVECVETDEKSNKKQEILFEGKKWNIQHQSKK